MSAIFVSHSSRDNAAAASVLKALEAWGYSSVFLDFDPALGIPPGRLWERELYAQLRSCRAVVVLCSAASMASPWCFAEITHAKALGKAIFPLRLGACTIADLLTDFQVLDLDDSEDTLARLQHGLREAGLDPRALIPWNRDRPPYPGLQAFDRDDAGMYFGREREVQAVLEKLNQRQRLPGPRLALIVGASGSGKSSLVRAGVLPRLALDAAAWIVCEPFRPQGDPVERCAAALEQTLRRLGVPTGWREIAATLRADEAARRTRLAALLTDLRSAAGQLAATLVITVDQAEELYALAPAPETQVLLAALKTLLELPGQGAFAFATLRSDYLAAWQQHDAATKPETEIIALEAMGAANLAECIEKPALLAGLELEPGLVQAMVADTGTQDALPLLAFALHALWRRRGAEGRLSLADYRDDLGGLQGAVAKAADALLAGTELNAPLEALLKRSFSALVRVGDSGEWVRRAAAIDDLPADVRPLLDRFVAERLLVIRADAQGRRSVEVAHEALFRSWGRLRGWLDEDREFLLWRRRLEAAVEAWRASAQDPSLVWRGAPLVQAERWVAERGSALDAAEQQFIAAGVARRRAATLRRRWIAAGTYAGVGGAVLLGVYAWFQQQAANQNELRVRARQLVRSAELVQGESPRNQELSALLAIESLRSAWTLDGQIALRARLARLPPPAERSWKAHKGVISALAISADGRWAASADRREVAVWDLAGGTELRRLVPQRTPLGQQYTALAWSPDGAWLAAGCNHTVCLWRSADWSQQPDRTMDRADQVWSLAFTHDSRKLAAAAYQAPAVALFDPEAPDKVDWLEASGSSGTVFDMAMDASGTRFATVSPTEGVERWQLAAEGPQRERLARRGNSVAMNAEGDVYADADGQFQRWPVGEKNPTPLQDGNTDNRPRPGARPRLALSPDGRYLAASPDGRVWDTATGRNVMLFAGGVEAVRITPDHRLISAEGGQLAVRPLALAGGAVAAMVHKAPARGLELSPDGSRVAIAAGDGVSVHAMGSWALQWSKQVDGGVQGVRIAAGLVAAWQGGKVLLYDRDGMLLHTWDSEAPVASIRFGRDGGAIAAVHAQGPAKLLATAPPYAAIVLDHAAESAQFSPDGKWLATYSAGQCTRGVGITRLGLIALWNAATGAPAARQSREPQAMVTVCRGQPLDRLDTDSPASGVSGDRSLLEQAVQWEDPQLRAEPRPTADGLLMAVRKRAAFDLQETASGRSDPPVPDDLKVNDAALSGDRRWELTAHDDGVVRVWALTVADLIAATCARLTRGLTVGEATKYLGGPGAKATCADGAKR